MEETLRLELLARTKEALDADDWNSVADLWRPWVQQGDAEAEYQLAYHYLWCTLQEDDATCDRMWDLLRDAAGKDHPDANWLLASRHRRLREADPEFERLLLRAGRLGSVNAQRELGVLYATGDRSGPKDLGEAARWYRLAAEKGDAESQYDLGFMLLLGEGGPKNIEEGLMWLERAGELGEYKAFGLLVDCYRDGHWGVSLDQAKAALWRHRLEEYEHLRPADPSRRYSIDGPAGELSLECLWEIEGVIGFTFLKEENWFSVTYEPAVITPGQLDDRVRAAVLSALPAD
jgi:TPR repeat protein